MIECPLGARWTNLDIAAHETVHFIDIAHDVLSRRISTLWLIQQPSNGPGTLNKKLTYGWKLPIL